MMVMRFGGPGAGAPGAPSTPEQIAAMRKNALQAAHEDFARLTLGMFASSFSAFPIEFSYAGQAESPDGKADVIGVKGSDDFQARLFVRQREPPAVDALVDGQGADGHEHDRGAGARNGVRRRERRAIRQRWRRRSADDARTARPDDEGDSGPHERGGSQAPHRRVPPLLQRLPGRERREAAVQAAAIDRRQTERGDDARQGQDQSEDRSRRSSRSASDADSAGSAGSSGSGSRCSCSRPPPSRKRQPTPRGSW